ncbi:MAG: tautomerase family protein [Paracoccaceae bacterium]
MPVIRIEMYEGRSTDQKRACAKAVTEAWVATCGGTAQSVQIIFTDVSQSDWAAGGRLASDPKPAG